ncbi:MAG: agmatinase [Methanobacteriaceae archaeon]|nr:agmatinase [Methanobacteriaceae archaeon]
MFLHTNPNQIFAFSQLLPEDNNVNNGYAILGIPFDSTTCYLSGSRYGPQAIREASYNFEVFNISSKKDLNIENYDIGNIDITPGNYTKTHIKIKDTIKELQNLNLKPITLGGEHTITCGVLEAMKEYDPKEFEDLTVIVLDAHMDLRDSYLEEKYSHATTIKRVAELEPKQIIQLGIRSACKEEYLFAKNNKKIKFYTNRNFFENKKEILTKLSSIKTPIYISVDIDVLDPSYAPSVGTPASCGLTPLDIEDIIINLSKCDVKGLDVVEVSSNTIGDITSVNASKIIYDFLSAKSN